MFINEKYLKKEGNMGIYKGKYIMESFANLMEVMKKDGNRFYLEICKRRVISRFQNTKKMWGHFLIVAVFQELR